MTQVFVHEKNWEGCGGLKLDPSIRVCIAAQACLLILHLDHEWYRKVSSILVYPGAFLSNMPSVGPGGVVRTAETAHAGEAWLGGEVILAWDSAFHGGRNPDDGRNTVFHEFAHKLDMLDGYADGTPPLGNSPQQKEWTAVLTKEFSELCADTTAGRNTLLDSYGSTNPAEFFAVATEIYFERGADMARASPDLYQCLANFYNQNSAGTGFSR
jgi:Mlc titration factor MtfA (ptsG expression regulator)